VRDAAPQAVFVFIPSAQAPTFAKQFVERGLDKAGIKLIGPGDLTDDEALSNMGDAMLGAVTAHFYSAAHPSALNTAAAIPTVTASDRIPHQALTGSSRATRSRVAAFWQGRAPV